MGHGRNMWTCAQYKPKLWLEKMEMYANGEVGEDECRKRSNQKRHAFQHNNTLILHHTTSFQFSGWWTEGIYNLVHVARVSGVPLCCRPLPGKQHKTWIPLFASWNTHGSGVEVQQWCIVACTARTLYQTGLAYNGYIWMRGTAFWFACCYAVPQSQTTNAAKGIYLSRISHKACTFIWYKEATC